MTCNVPYDMERCVRHVKFRVTCNVLCDMSRFRVTHHVSCDSSRFVCHVKLCVTCNVFV